MRMMSPEGSLGEIPDEQVVAAVAQGFRVMTAQDLADMYQRTFMTHMLLKNREEKLKRQFQRRQSLRKQMRRGRER